MAGRESSPPGGGAASTHPSLPPPCRACAGATFYSRAVAAAGKPPTCAGLSRQLSEDALLEPASLPPQCPARRFQLLLPRPGLLPGRPAPAAPAPGGRGTQWQRCRRRRRPPRRGRPAPMLWRPNHSGPGRPSDATGSGAGGDDAWRGGGRPPGPPTPARPPGRGSSRRPRRPARSTVSPLLARPGRRHRGRARPGVQGRPVGAPGGGQDGGQRGRGGGRGAQGGGEPGGGGAAGRAGQVRKSGGSKQGPCACGVCARVRVCVCVGKNESGGRHVFFLFFNLLTP